MCIRDSIGFIIRAFILSLFIPSNGLQPIVLIYQLILNGLKHIGFIIRAFILSLSLPSNGLQPIVLIYQLILNGLKPIGVTI